MDAGSSTQNKLTPTTSEIQEFERITAQTYPTFLIEKNFLTIKSKTEELISFALNSVQKIILEKVNSILKEEKPLRLWILKARQGGVSTLIESLLYVFTSLKEGVNSAVISHDLDSSNYLFEMQKLFYERLEGHLKPRLRHSNEKKLEFDRLHSQILIDTAENKRAGRAFTFRYVHLSEVAFFRDLKGLLLGLAQTVPNASNTMIIGETTANGIGGDFYEQWQKAKEGKSDWQILFIPWFKIAEYVFPLEKNSLYPLMGINFLDVEKFILEEKSLKEKYNLSLEQLNWRRWCIVNNCAGDLLKFRQEYPSTDEEAFITSGKLFFEREALLNQQEKPYISGNIVKYEGKWVFRKTPDGRFKIYEFPEGNEQYCIGADTAEGLPSGDKCAAECGNKKTTNTCATYNLNISPDEFSEDLIALGHFYNEATIAPENKGYGYIVCQNLWRWGYPYIYRQVKDRKGILEPGQNLGFNTNTVTRPQILGQLYEEIKNNSTCLYDGELIRQCWSFIKDPDKPGKPHANKGANDDLLIARAIRGQVMIYHPYRMKRRRFKRLRFKGLSGY